MERVYAIAITASDLATQFGYQLDELQGLCQPGISFPETLSFAGGGPPNERIHQWQQYLKRLATQYPEKLQWREFRFWHDRPL
jgi:hypothetical protein